MKKQWRLKLAGALVALLFTAACVETVLIGLGASAALGGYKWMEGTMEKDYPKPMQETYNAALAAAKTLNLKVGTAAYNPLDSRIEASQPDGTSVVSAPKYTVRCSDSGWLYTEGESVRLGTPVEAGVFRFALGTASKP